MKYISWIGTAASICGSFLVALQIVLLGYCFFLVGTVSWLYIGLKRRDRPLMVLNGAFLVANIIGFYNVIHQFWVCFSSGAYAGVCSFPNWRMRMIDNKGYDKASTLLLLKYGDDPIRNPIILRFRLGRVISLSASKHLTRSGCIYRKFWRMKARAGII